MPDRIYRFAEFELNPAAGELHSGAATIRLQGKPLLLLSELLDHPQQVVTRGQLRKRMWDSRTVVEYEQGINVAIKKLRDALGDSAESPRLIETVAKKGYRLLVPVTVIDTATALRGATTAQEVPASAQAPEIAGNVKHRFSRHWPALALAAAVVCVVALSRFEIQIRPRHSGQIHSLAVLPLEDVSPEPRSEYFADGITEEVITNLSQTLRLRVISRSSVMGYKRTDVSVAQIARELGVDTVVKGTLARSADRLSITVQLIDAKDGRRLWAGEYDRRLQDVLAVEAEISQAIATQVGGTPPVRDTRLARQRPVDSRVHELCLMGRYYWNKRTVADFAKAEDYFRQAVARDPTYAPAYAGLADVYALWPSYGTISLADSYGKAISAARHALELDDTLAEPHATLGFLGLVWSPGGTWNEPEFRRALELNPSYATAHHWYAFQLLFMRRSNESLAEIALARQLDPLSTIINADEGHFLYAVRRYDEARIRVRRAIELAPDFGQPHSTLALVELETRHIPEALREAHTALALDPHNPRTMGEAGYVFAAAGQTAEAKQMLRALEDLGRQGTSIRTFAALIDMGLGQRDAALDTLEEMARTDANSIEGLMQWHGFDDLSTDMRYHQLFVREQ